MKNKFERIEGKNIVLRKAELSDQDVIYENLWGDRTISDLMFWRPSASDEETVDRLYKTMEYQKDKYLYFVALKDTNEAIGMAGMKEESFEVYSEEGIAIARKYQRHGYGKEVLLLLMKTAFVDLNAKQFIYYCMEHNEISRNLALKMGFTYDITESDIRKHDQKEFNLQRYYLNRDTYFKLYDPKK